MAFTLLQTLRTSEDHLSFGDLLYPPVARGSFNWHKRRGVEEEMATVRGEERAN